MEGWAEWVKGGGRYRLPVTELPSHGDKKYSIGNLGNGLLIALHNDRWELHL